MLSWISTYYHLNYARWAPVYFADMLSLEQSAPEVYQDFVGGNFVVKKNQWSNQSGSHWLSYWMGQHIM